MKSEIEILWCNDCKRESIFKINEDQDPVQFLPYHLYSNGKRLRECVECGRYEEKRRTNEK